MRHRVAIGLACLALLSSGGVPAQTTPPLAAYLEALLPDRPPDAQLGALKAIAARGDRAAIPALIELLRFDLPIPHELVAGVLEQLSAQKLGRHWGRWVEWLQKQTDIHPPAEFVVWKGQLYGLIDPEFTDWFRPGVPHRVRMEEIVWGGVVKDGIPALVNPSFVRAVQATYLTDDELVFGVTLNGDSRAYPHRIMDWHEMANDVVGGVPVALAY